MGDVIHGMPAVAALRRRHPEAWIGWAVEPRWRALLEGEGQMVDRIHAVPTGVWKQRPLSFGTARDLLRLRRELRAQRYDVCVDLQGSLRSAVIGKMAGARRLVGSATPREWPAQWLYDQRVEVRCAHVIDQAGELMSAALAQPLPLREASIPLRPEAEAWADRTLGQAGFCLLAPTAGWGAKQWPPARYAELASALRGEDVRVLVNAAGAEDEAARSIVRESGAQQVECGVAELIAMVRRAGVVVGGDTGPLHLAAALGRPVVGLFGPTDPARSGPRASGARTVVLRHESSVIDHRRHLATEAGLSRVEVSAVLRAVQSALKDRAGWSCAMRKSAGGELG